MRKLHVFGCSHTYGQGITDNDWKNDKQTIIYPSKHSWAAKLAQSINFELVNHALPGAGNHLILTQVKKAINPSFPWKTSFNEGAKLELPSLRPNSDDIAAILFTYYNRSVFYNLDGFAETFLTADPKLNRPWTSRTRAFYRLYNSQHLEQVSLYEIEHTYLYLKNFGIPFVAMFLFPISDALQSTVLEEMVIDSVDPVIDIVERFPYNSRMGSDNDHWSIPVHEEIAKFAEQRIQRLITSS